MKTYIRFGEIPENERSAIHLGDEIIGYECGVSVWDCVEADNRYYPVLPRDANESSITDYFDFLLNSESKVYLVTGNCIRVEGQDREPILRNVKILEDLTRYFRKINENEHD